MRKMTNTTYLLRQTRNGKTIAYAQIQRRLPYPGLS